MRIHRVLLVASLSSLLSLLFASSAFAHIHLISPPDRYASNGVDGLNKHCPCGGGAGTQSCSGSVTSDPNRTGAVTTLAAGDTVTVTWNEDVGHSGRMRIAFDNDGADLADFNAHILVDISDPPGSAGENCTLNSSTPTDVTCTASGSTQWSATFNLPNTPCTNCTLQLIQDMNGNTTTPVLDPTGDATYFECANLVLTGASTGEGEGEGSAGEGEGSVGEGEGSAGEGEGSGGEGEGSVGEGEGTAAGEGEGAAAGEGEGAAAGEGEGEGEGEGAKLVGCASCNSSGDSGALMAFGVLGLALVRRRRR